MWVKDYMSEEVHTIAPEKTIQDAIEIMVHQKTNSLVVVNEKNEPIGTVSSYAIIKEVVPAYLKGDPIFSNFGTEGTLDKYAEKSKDKKIKDIMHEEFHILKKDDAMIEAASYAIEASRRMLPVVDDDGKVIGVINRTSIKNALHNAICNCKKKPS